MIYGIGSHIVSTNKVKCVNITKDIGSTSLREDISWDSAEASIGAFALTAHHQAKIEATQELGTDNIMILSYGNTAHGVGQPYTQAERDKFCDYVEWLVPLVSGSCKYIEIWNEWNHGAGASAAQVTSGQHSGTQQYVDLCAAVYPIIKALAPNAIVLAGSTSKVWTGHWYPALCDAGILAYCDGFSVHPYTHSETYPNNLPARSFEYLDDIDTLVKAKNGGVSFPIYVTEMGWPTHDTGHSAAKVAQWLATFYYSCEARSWIKGVWWYDIFDSGSDSANSLHRFGLDANDALTPKPAHHAYRAFIRRANRNEENGWCRIAVTAAIESEINAKTSPTNIKESLDRLVSTGTTTVINSITYNVMTGPINLSALDEIGERWGDSFHITEGPVVKGVTPAQTTATKTTTWPNGWN